MAWAKQQRKAHSDKMKPRWAARKAPATVEVEPVGIQAVLNERGARYGAFNGHASTTQNLKRAMHTTAGWARLNDSQKEALEMLQHKIGRILNGDPAYLDSWVDIVGYTQLVVNELESQHA